MTRSYKLVCDRGIPNVLLTRGQIHFRYCVLIMMGIQDVCEVGEKVFSANLEN